MKVGKRSRRSELVEQIWIGVVGHKPVPIRLEHTILLNAGDTLGIDLTADDLFDMVDAGKAFRAELEAFDDVTNTEERPFDKGSYPPIITGEAE